MISQIDIKLRLNDIFCENKTHEFIISCLNYLINNEKLEIIKVYVHEPQLIISPLTSNKGKMKKTKFIIYMNS